VVPHDLMATLAAARAKTAEETRAGRIPVVVGGDDSILFPAVAGFHDAVAGTVAIVHFDAHLDLMDESPAQGRYSHSSGMRRALEPRVGGFALNEVNPLTDAGPKTTILAANLVFQFVVAAAGRHEGGR